MEILDIAVAIIVGIGIGFGMIAIYVWFFLYLPIKSRVDRIIAQVVAEAEDHMIGLDIELDRGVYFCYNNKDKQFVCQGTTVQEIRQVFGARFPGKTAYLAGGDPAVVEHFKTELLQSDTNENSLGQ
jgi:hypothetical protein